MPEVIVLDTHMWIGFVNLAFENFPSEWKERIETASQVGISPVSCYEIALAQRRGRLQLPCSTNQWFQAALEPSGIELFPLTSEICSRAVNLSSVHRDPFDRIIIATALEYQASLASVDSIFHQYPELGSCLMQ
ncbi:type II toxin-antitoxin system VapC family toxin [Leptolyngbya sp. NK1-12]|uniref:Type II toxin-antitoxin system VapC family toxin n=1 Tax=Leptolyngbya sp. NK1-12 TaxID=2547451 RepID=A0AA97AJE3_9CYAN|nr:type II toxin-antitoxin system VapC family toxin [Leptolyngbya sp. NK1-12]